MFLRALRLSLVLAACPGLALAQGGASEPNAAARQAVRKACAADLKTYCSDLEPGKGRMGQCLRENFAKLSPDCQAQLKQLRSMRNK